MECDKVKNLLSNYLENDLNDLQKAQVEYHINTCKSCQAEFESLKVMIRNLGDLKKVPAPKGLLEGIHADLGIEPKKESLFKRIKIPLEAAGVLASIVLIIFFVNQNGILTHPKTAELAKTRKNMEHALPAGSLGSQIIPAETSQAERAVYDKSLEMGPDYINKVKDLVKVAGGEIEKQEHNKLETKIPAKNCPVLLENLKNISAASPTVTGQKDDSVYMTIEFPKAE